MADGPQRIQLHVTSLVLPSCDEVHLWWLQHSLTAASTEWLTDDERRRAKRFLAREHADAFVCVRSALRGLLGAYLGCFPSQPVLAAGRWGKPHLADSPLRFNLSHSGEWAVFAFATGREIGVDVEQVRADRDLIPIAHRFFAPSEVECLSCLSASEQVEAFYRIWTRKEAVIKAHGAGLSLPLDSFAVSAGPEARLVTPPPDTPSLRLEALSAPTGYASALCVDGPVLEIISRTLNPRSGDEWENG